MLPSEPNTTRRLVIDTETPGTEVFIHDANGNLVERGIRRIETELPLALYKIRYRVGDHVADQLIELTPGQNPLYVPVPPLPIFSPAPSSRSSGTASDRASEFAQELIEGPHVQHGSGASLFVFVSANPQVEKPPPQLPGAALSIRSFSGELIADLASARAEAGCAGHKIELNPGCYLLRAVLDAALPVEQTIVVSRGWETRVYIQLVESVAPSGTSTSEGRDPTPGWKPDLSQLGVIMVRDGTQPGPDDVRWTAAARQALAARRSEAAPNREMMYALLQGKFQNPMLGIYGGHLLAMQKEPDRELLREVYANLLELVGEHPDVRALLIALGDKEAQKLSYPQPPMLYSSWALLVQASSTSHDLRPERSYSARIAASLWGGGAWLSWRMPPPVAETDTSTISPGFLQALISEASSGRLDKRLEGLSRGNLPLSTAERLLITQLMAMSKRVQLANEVTTEEDESSFLSRLLRVFVDSDLQKKTKEKLAVEFAPEKLLDLTGIPYSSMVEAASTLGQKLGVASSSVRSSILGGLTNIRRS